MIEEIITNVVLWLKLAVETVGALLIGVGAIVTFGRFLRVLVHSTVRGFEGTRLLLARFLWLGLEF